MYFFVQFTFDSVMKQFCFTFSGISVPKHSDETKGSSSSLL